MRTKLMSSVSHIAMGNVIASQKYMARSIFVPEFTCELCGQPNLLSKLAEIQSKLWLFTCRFCGHEMRMKEIDGES